jgi:hypothetical protein
MTRYITIPEAIDLVAKDISDYYFRSEGYQLKFITDEINLELALVFSATADSISGTGLSHDVRPLVSLVEDGQDADRQGTATSSHRLSLKLRALAPDGRELKISTGDIVGSWRSR